MFTDLLSVGQLSVRGQAASLCSAGLLSCRVVQFVLTFLGTIVEHTEHRICTTHKYQNVRKIVREKFSMSRLSVKGTLSSTYREEKGTQINEFIHVFFFHEGTKSYDSSIIRDILRVIHSLMIHLKQQSIS